MITFSQVVERWNNRIVPNAWHTMGNIGAQAYLKKYGHNISYGKKKAISDYARNQGYSAFADGMLGIKGPDKKTVKTETTKITEENVSFPIFSFWANSFSKTHKNSFLAETTAQNLVKLNAFFVGWNVPVWGIITREFPCLRVRTCLGEIDRDGKTVYETGDVDIWTDSEEQAEKISFLSRTGRCKLVNYFYEEGWTYFSSERI